MKNLNELVEDLTTLINRIYDVLWEINYRSLEEATKPDCNSTEDLKEKLIQLINKSWGHIDEISKAIHDDIAISDIKNMTELLLEFIHKCRGCRSYYTKLENKNLLDDSMSISLHALLTNLEELSNKILEYNKKFSPKLKTMKALLKEIKRRNKRFNKQFYKEIMAGHIME